MGGGVRGYTVRTVDGLKRRDIYGESRKEVMERLREALDENQRGRLHASVNLGDFLRNWLANSVKGSVSPRTFERYEQIVRLHIEPALGQIKLRIFPLFRFKNLPGKA